MVRRGITMTDSIEGRTLHRLLAWMSPSFPVGAFTYSHGLESMVESGEISDLADLADWIADAIRYGAGWTDALLLRRTWLAEEDQSALNDLALALSPTRERRLETAAQGSAFLKTARDAWPWAERPDDDLVHITEVANPIAVGYVASGHGLALEPVLHAYLHGFAANLVSSGIRLIPLGQTDGQRALLILEDAISVTVNSVLLAEPGDLGGMSVRADIASAQHEVLYTRLFRS